MALINKQDAVNAINAVDNYDDGIAFEVLSHACRDVALLPEVDAEPVRHGRWIDYTDEGYVECDQCRSATNCDGDIEELNYCWHCGAKMDGKKNE